MRLKQNKRLLICALIFLALIIIGLQLYENPEKGKLSQAIDAGNYQAVREVLLDNPEAANYSIKGRPVLEVAIKSGTSNADKISALLIQNGADVNKQLENKSTYLIEGSNQLLPILIKAGADISARDENGFTVLDYIMYNANEEKRDEIIECRDLLIQHGAKPDGMTMQACLNNPDGYGFTCEVLELIQKYGNRTGISKGLEFAIQGKGLNVIREAKADRIPDEEKEKVILYAAKNCDVMVLKELLKLGYDFKVEDGFGQTPLDLAAQYNDVEVLTFLAELGFNIDNISDESATMNMSPILYALVSGKEDKVNFFYENGIKFIDSEYMPLWDIACGKGNLDSVKILRKYVGEPDAEDLYAGCVASAERKNEDGRSIFNYLLKQYDILSLTNEFGVHIIADLLSIGQEKAEKLLKQGAFVDSDVVCNAMLEYPSMVESFIIACDDINFARTGMPSPLMTAIYYGEFDSVKLLIEYGANINKLYVNEDGYAEAAIHVAAYSASEDILQYLINHGANLELTDSKGKTPYEIAKAAGLQKNVQILKSYE